LSHAKDTAGGQGLAARPVVECRQRAVGHSSLDAALDRLMMGAKRPGKDPTITYRNRAPL
jgi:hypothetical protein